MSTDSNNASTELRNATMYGQFTTYNGSCFVRIQQEIWQYAR